MHKLTVLLAVFIQITVVNSKVGYGPGEQDWGFAEVSKGSFMFYWLYYTRAAVKNYTERPLIVWLQGGPGVAASYFANLNFIGPINTDLNYRSDNWMQHVNVVFVDNPVGTGFSYVDNFFKHPTNNTQIALHLVEFMKIFYKKYPEFLDVPVHIFGESYAGKMAAEFALEFYKAHANGQIERYAESVNVANPWISPQDYLYEGPATAYYAGVLGKHDMEILACKFKKIEKLLKKKMYLWTGLYAIVVMKNVACRLFQGVSLYNHAYKVREENKDLCGDDFLDYKNATIIMNGPVREALNITDQKWKPNYMGIVNLAGDLFKPVIHIVNQLLNSTTVKVNIFSGSYDFLVPTAGTLSWIEKLAWDSRSDYDEAKRKAIYIDGYLEGFEKIGKNFGFYWIQRSGHMVAKDNLAALTYAMKKIVNIDQPSEVKENSEL